MFAHVLRAFGWKPKVNVLVLGFYDRGNLGDELYKEAIPAVVNKKNARFTFRCTDDIDTIPEDTDVVLCGGGDIINAYFMRKIAALCESYVGPIYAVSVGIPYSDGAKYLKLFDHVYVRSSGDYQVAAAEIGAENVTQIADAVFALDLKSVWSLPRWCDRVTSESCRTHIGIALAAPYFCALPQLIDDLEKLCNLLIANQAKIHLFAFNTHALNPTECDTVVIEELVKRLEGAATIEVHTSRTAVLTHFQRMDVTLCMRYHSVVLAMMFGVPFVALYSTPKIERLLLDAGEPLNAHAKLPHAGPELLAFKLGRRAVAASRRRTMAFPPQVDLRLRDFEYKVIIHKPETSPLQLVVAQVERMLQMHLGDDAWRNFPLCGDGKVDATQVARVICYGITGDAGHECIWGLAKNMQAPNFVLEEAVKYIYNYHKTRRGDKATTLPALTVKRTCLFNVDPYYDFSPSNKVHRSGWSYVLSHLMNLDACRLGRRSTLLLDTYVDRTFHWGLETLQSIGATPYTTPWIGIIHHTFDTTHSDFNCKRLFENPVFLRALRHCRGLVALSDYLAAQIKEALALASCFQRVPVTTIYHPTQTVSTRFSWAAYVRNPDRKLVQIGAWLRRPYSIYALRLSKRSKIRKAALRGKNMDAYFPPSGLEVALGGLTPEWAGDVAYTCCGVSRGGTTSNKFVDGLLHAVSESIGSVEVMGPLDDEAYDDLLSKNVVFLDLVDCSAVNTVIECIVRDTPVVVNRHPALEEVLGKSYPGFYSDAQEQVPRLLTHACLRAMHQHMVRMDKKRFEISTFLSSLQAFAQTPR